MNFETGGSLDFFQRDYLERKHKNNNINRILF